MEAINILDVYTKEYPSPQTTIDLFKNKWSSKLPDINGVAIESGFADLFDDSRIKLMNESYSLENKTVLILSLLNVFNTFAPGLLQYKQSILTLSFPLK